MPYFVHLEKGNDYTDSQDVSENDLNWMWKVYETTNLGFLCGWVGK